MWVGGSELNERTINERTINEQTINERTINERTINEQTINSLLGVFAGLYQFSIFREDECLFTVPKWCCLKKQRSQTCSSVNSNGCNDQIA